MSSTGQQKESIPERLANVIILICSPLIFVFLIVISLVVLVEAGAVFFSRRPVAMLDKLAKAGASEGHR